MPEQTRDLPRLVSTYYAVPFSLDGGFGEPEDSARNHGQPVHAVDWRSRRGYITSPRPGQAEQNILCNISMPESTGISGWHFITSSARHPSAQTCNVCDEVTVAILVDHMMEGLTLTPDLHRRVNERGNVAHLCGAGTWGLCNNYGYGEMREDSGARDCIACLRRFPAIARDVMSNRLRVALLTLPTLTNDQLYDSNTVDVIPGVAIDFYQNKYYIDDEWLISYSHQNRGQYVVSPRSQFSENHTRCGNCASMTDRSVMVQMHGRTGPRWLFCTNCVRSVARRCDACGVVAARNDFMHCQDHNGSVCSYCHQDAPWCEICEYTYCNPESHEACRRAMIHGWDYRPSLQFFGENPAGLKDTFFGFELEVICADRLKAEIPNQCPQLYVKSDSSIGDLTDEHGFEIVSHPMSWSFIKNDLNLDWIPQLREAGAKVDGSCGLHVHISRKGFASAFHAYKFMELIYKMDNRPQWIAFSRRECDGYASFDDHETPMIKAKGSTEGERYVALNSTNLYTYEFRAPLSTLDRRFLKGTIAGLAAAIDYTRNMPLQIVVAGGLEWDAFVTWAAEKPEYSEFMEYLRIIQPRRSTNMARLIPPSALAVTQLV